MNHVYKYENSPCCTDLSISNTNVGQGFCSVGHKILTNTMKNDQLYAWPNALTAINISTIL